MKKRFVTTLIALIACIACVLGLVACGADSVAGKTYNFEKVEITSDLDSEIKETAETQLKSVLNSGYIKFGEDGTFTMSIMGSSVSGTYVQDGGTLTLTVNGSDAEAKVSGDTVTTEDSVEGVGVKITFKLAATEAAE